MRQGRAVMDKRMGIRDHYADKGWVRLPWSRDVARWSDGVRPAALQAIAAPQNAGWLRHGGTWFAGVNALPNDPAGDVGGSGALPEVISAALDQLELRHDGLDRAQISVVYPGYPRQDADESDAAHRFRRARDAAHVDGLLPVGPNRRRMLREPHGFVLGLPLSETAASPLVVWEGSHTIMRARFHAALAGVPQADWPDVDLTQTYAEARRYCFETCARVPVMARPGEAYIVHRHALHGVAPWEDSLAAPKEGRVILYFRPELPQGLKAWLAP